MHSRSSNIKFLYYNDVNKVADELIESLRSIYLGNLERSMRGHDFNLDSVQLLRYKRHKTNLKRGGSYIFIYKPYFYMVHRFSRLDRKEKKNQNVRKIQMINALNYEKIKRNPERVSDIKQFINTYNWKGKNYPSKIDD